jgi:hypothetical protein
MPYPGDRKFGINVADRHVVRTGNMVTMVRSMGMLGSIGSSFIESWEDEYDQQHAGTPKRDIKNHYGIDRGKEFGSVGKIQGFV